jgi:curved DNA-binding protein CbpA
LAGPGDDPYETLGVARDAPFDTITQAYRRAMQAVHPDRGHPRWISQVLGAAYRQVGAVRPNRRKFRRCAGASPQWRTLAEGQLSEPWPNRLESCESQAAVPSCSRPIATVRSIS